MSRPADLVSGPNVYADLRRLADSAPVVRVMLHGRVPAYLLTRPDDIANAAVDPRLTSDDSFLRTGRSSVKIGFMGLDGPEHARLRRSATAALAPRRIHALRPYLRRVIAEAVGAVLPAGRADLVTDVALPVAMRVICELLGIPFGDREDFEHVANQLLLPTGDPVAARRHLYDYLAELVRTNDLSGATDDLTEREVVETMALLLVAGYQTTADLIGSAMLALLENPEQLTVLRDDLSTSDRVIHELVRYCGPMAIGVTRYTKETVVLAGTTVPPGERVVLGLGCANRDPTLFPDPGRLNLRRAPTGHFSFGRGPHYCLGAALARLEAKLVITTLCRELRQLRLAGEPTWRTTIFTGVQHLPVTFTARPHA